MTSEPRCEVTELLKSQCAHCRPSRQVEVPELPDVGPWFEARFDSDCDGPCGGQIFEGDQCRSDGEGGWLCQRCGSHYA